MFFFCSSILLASSTKQPLKEALWPMVRQQSRCLLPPAVSIFSQVSYDRFLVGQAFMRCFKTCL